MKRIGLLVATAFALVAVVVLARDPGRDGGARTPLTVRVEEHNPWTHLRVADDPGQFHFAVVSDRTGGHRAGIFSRAVHQLNLLRPAFVVSVGDIIEGSEDAETNRRQWQEIDGYLAKLTVPFFYAPGNHDAANPAKAQVWKERFGRSYYHFRYQNTLFLLLNCFEDQDGSEAARRGRKFSDGQLAYVKQALADNADVRWTFVMLHQPLWTGADVAATGWLDVEKLLAGRKYTVFCGHIHVYRKFLRNGMNYYQLATTGGGSSLRGVKYGEFDQVAWVTMTPDGPVVANVLLDGIYPDDLKQPETAEGGRVPGKAKGLARVHGTVTLDGKPLAGAAVSFYAADADRARLTGQARTEADGAFEMYVHRGSPGLAPGKYEIEVGPAPPIVVTGRDEEKSAVPKKYRSRKTSGLTVEVVAGQDNVVNLELTSTPQP
jgi:serine/threonine-protein phosphatase CPPED1